MRSLPGKHSGERRAAGSAATRREPDGLAFAKRRVREQRISVKSLIVTVFGDTVSQHGCSVSLSSLIGVLRRIGLGERVIRTSMNRLLHEGLLQFHKVGRQSHYSFSETGQHHSERAERRIYNPDYNDADEDWTLVIADAAPAERLRQFQQGLSWLGYRPLRPGLFAHYADTRAELSQLVEDLGIDPHPVVFTASINADVPSQAVKRLIYSGWGLEELATRYRDFCDSYRPALRRLERQPASEEASFFLRTVMVHEYRRVLLKDPELPAGMLPVVWPGFAAREIAARLYRLLAERSHAFIVGHFGNAQGAVPPARAAFHRRFGGIAPAAR